MNSTKIKYSFEELLANLDKEVELFKLKFNEHNLDNVKAAIGVGYIKDYANCRGDIVKSVEQYGDLRQYTSPLPLEKWFKQFIYEGGISKTITEDFKFKFGYEIDDYNHENYDLERVYLFTTGVSKEAKKVIDEFYLEFTRNIFCDIYEQKHENPRIAKLAPYYELMVVDVSKITNFKPLLYRINDGNKHNGIDSIWAPLFISVYNKFNMYKDIINKFNLEMYMINDSSNKVEKLDLEKYVGE